MAGAVEIPAGVVAIKFIAMTPKMAFSLVGIGFVGGMLSGFLGSGGAFIMTPAMMSLGIPGIMAVAANITHKFGKAIMGRKNTANTAMWTNAWVWSCSSPSLLV